MKRIVIFLVFLLFYSQNSFANKIINQTFIDSSRVFKIDNALVHCNRKFEYISLVKSSKDTLKFIACSEFLCSPFGKINNAQTLKSSLLNNFKIIESKKNTSIVLKHYSLLSLKHNSSSLKLLLSNYTSKSRYSYVSSGEIVDSDVIFDNKIKIGLSVELFYSQFFSDFPDELKNQYNVIIFSPCIDNIPTHIYTFKDGKLNNIKFL